MPANSGETRMRVLEIRDLVKGYDAPDGEHNLIIDVPAFGLDAGEHVALAGASGSGKTTLLNLIAGILQPDRGEVQVAGQRISSLSEAQRDRVRAQHIGYIFQTFNLLPGCTALENVELGMCFGRGLDAAYGRWLLERVGLGNRVNHRPRQLSVGQQQRVAVARALANHPSLVLADEPTGNLDRRHAREALELIRQICNECGAALLLVSHDSEALSGFGRVVQLAQLNRAAAAEAGHGPGTPVVAGKPA